MEPESSLEDLERIGRTLARVHQVGMKSQFLHRHSMSAAWYLDWNRPFVDEFLPAFLKNRYDDCVAKSRFAWASLGQFPTLRLHGDCHRGNILWRPDEGPLLVDFDDAINGPMIQDVWLLFSGRIANHPEEFKSFLKGYELFLDFDDRQLALVEVIRAFRMIQYSGWIARRWKDPSFQMAFPHFATENYWIHHIADLEEQVQAFSGLQH